MDRPTSKGGLARITTNLIFTDGISNLFNELIHPPISLCSRVTRIGEASR